MADPGSLPPFKPTDFHILIALLDGPRHGYQIMKDVERESGGSVRVEVGTLYRVLARLLELGVIEEQEEDGRRRCYGLTRLGLRAVKAEAARLEGVVDLLRARKLLPPRA